MWDAAEVELKKAAAHFTKLFARLPADSQEKFLSLQSSLDVYISEIISKISTPTVTAIGNAAKHIPNAIIGIIICFLSAYFFIADKESRAANYAGQIRTELGNRLNLIEENAYRFCFINDFPMYEYDPEEKKLVFTHNPFSMPQGGLEALLTKDPLEILAYQYDIVCNGVELSSGAVRNHDLEIMVKAFSMAGYTEDELKTKFGALYQAFQFGAPPHAGMAPGVDRIIMLLRNEENIREIIPFPMNGNAQDLMCNAPGEVTKMQLREVHIKLQ